ncbi:MAG: dynamin family protein [Peptostreptococcaceae bacterium]
MDNIKKNIYEIKELVLKSPLRERLSNSENIPYKDLIENNLNTVIENIKNLEENKKESINIVIVGEVKAGKSSLLNAILGQEISVVDVLESTSGIIEVSYNKNTYTKKIGDITQVKLDNELLKKVNIIDTPGLKSITTRNEQKTLNYIKQADIILFVLDGTHLGQEDILEALDIIAQCRKTIVGIINKADLLGDNKEETMEYAIEEYGLYIDNFFLISSYLEYQDKISKYAKAKSTDLTISNYNELRKNFNDLVLYIKEAEKKYETIKYESLKGSINSIIHKEIIVHHEYKQSLLVLIEELKKYDKLLQNKCDYIRAKMEFEVNDWSKRIFLVDELDRINNDIKNANYYINESYINELINKKKIQLDNLFFNEWSECLREVSDQIDRDIKKYIEEITYDSELIDQPLLKIDYEKANINDLLATVGTGAILGVTSGGIISLYSAALGSSAASVTITTALMTYCPPLLIAGTISGAIGKVIYDKVKNDNKNKEVLEDIDDYINKIRYRIIEDLNDGYNKSSQEIVITTLEVLRKLKGIVYNKYDVENLLNELDLYTDDVKKYISN